MDIAKQTRNESLAETRPHFNKQESEILIQLNLGKTDAWSIASATGLLITSVRRGLTDLSRKDFSDFTEKIIILGNKVGVTILNPEEFFQT